MIIWTNHADHLHNRDLFLSDAQNFLASFHGQERILYFTVSSSFFEKKICWRKNSLVLLPEKQLCFLAICWAYLWVSFTCHLTMYYTHWVLSSPNGSYERNIVWQNPPSRSLADIFKFHKKEGFTSFWLREIVYICVCHSALLSDCTRAQMWDFYGAKTFAHSQLQWKPITGRHASQTISSVFLWFWQLYFSDFSQCISLSCAEKFAPAFRAPVETCCRTPGESGLGFSCGRATSTPAWHRGARMQPIHFIQTNTQIYKIIK